MCFFFVLFQVSASDPDCGVNAMVNYTLGDGFKKMMEFEVKHTTGDICISGTLDYETRNSYEFPIIATDQGKKYTKKKSTIKQQQQKLVSRFVSTEATPPTAQTSRLPTNQNALMRMGQNVTFFFVCSFISS